MRRVRAFGRFWYEFVVGDDWVVAAGIAVALCLTALFADEDVSAWWVMPAAVLVLLAGSLRRATHHGAAGTSDRVTRPHGEE